MGICWAECSAAAAVVAVATSQVSAVQAAAYWGKYWKVWQVDWPMVPGRQPAVVVVALRRVGAGAVPACQACLKTCSGMH